MCTRRSIPSIPIFCCMGSHGLVELLDYLQINSSPKDSRRDCAWLSSTTISVITFVEASLTGPGEGSQLVPEELSMKSSEVWQAVSMISLPPRKKASTI